MSSPLALLTVNVIKLLLDLFNKIFLMAAIDPAVAGYPAHDECVGRCRDGIAGLCLSFVTRYVYSNLINGQELHRKKKNRLGANETISFDCSQDYVI